VKFQEASDAVQAAGTLTLTGGSIVVTAKAGGAFDGVAGTGVNVAITEATGATAAAYDSNTNTINISVDDSIAGGDTFTNIVNAINTALGSDFQASTTSGATQYNNTDDGTTTALANGFNGTTGALYNAGTNTIIVHVAVGE